MPTSILSEDEDEPHIPAEGEEGEEDEDDEQPGDLAHSPFAKLSPQGKKRALLSAKYNADTFLRQLNQDYPVPQNDPGIARFDSCFRRAVQRLHKRTKHLRTVGRSALMVVYVRDR